MEGTDAATGTPKPPNHGTTTHTESDIPATGSLPAMAVAATARSRTGGLSDVVVAFVVAAGLYGGLIWFATAYADGTHAPTFILVGITAGATGWLAGIALSPYNLSERSAFANISGAVYAFATGYVLSKFEPLVSDAIKAGATKPLDPTFARMLLFALASFVIAAALTYVTRAYWFSADEER